MVPVQPADQTFGGLDGSAAELRGWDWTHGRTPRFSVDTTLHLADGAGVSTATVHLEVKAGRVEACRLDLAPAWLPGGAPARLASLLLGARFCPSEATAIAVAFLRSEGHGATGARLRDLCDKMVALM